MTRALWQTTVALLCPVLCSSCAHVHSQTPELRISEESASETIGKFALLIGIDEYDYLSPDLRGAENDIRAMKRMLIGKYDFAPAGIRSLFGSKRQAGRVQILESIRTHLIDNARRVHARGGEAVIVLHFSGHGAQVPDRSGDEGGDGLDEVLVPQDARGAGGVIRDDELDALFAELSTWTRNITFVFDSCHSGTITRAVGVPRMLELPGEPDDSTDIAQPGGEQPYVLLSAARAGESAWEYTPPGQPTYGALTYFLTRTLEGSREASVTYRDIMDEVSVKVRTQRPQHPDVSGTHLDNLVFGVRDAIAEPYILVGQRNEQLVIPVGSAVGVREGTVLDVYPPSTRVFSDPSKRVTQIRVVEAGLGESVVRPVEGNPEPAVGTRAVIHKLTMTANPLWIHLDYAGEAHRNAISDRGRLAEARRKIEAEKVLQGNIAFIDAYVSGGSRYIDASIVITAMPHGDLGLIVGGRLVDTTKLDTIATKLQEWCVWSNVLSLENPQSSLDVHFRVEGPAVRERDDEGGLLLRPDDPITFHVRNTSGRRLYFGIVVLSSDGSRSLLWPPPGAAEPLEDDWSTSSTVYLPEELQESTDYCKLLVFDQAVDLTFLTTNAVPRGDLDTIFPIAMALLRARQERSVNPGAWTTRTLKFTVRR